MPDREDPQRLAAELLALVLRRAHELELQSALAGMAEARPAEIGARRERRAFGDERLVDDRVDASALERREL